MPTVRAGMIYLKLRREGWRVITSGSLGSSRRPACRSGAGLDVSLDEHSTLAQAEQRADPMTTRVSAGEAIAQA